MMSDPTITAAAAEPHHEEQEEYEYDDWELYVIPHGFEEGGCHWCPRPDTCDCPCATCIQGRRGYAQRLSEYEAAANEDPWDYDPVCLECGGYTACHCVNDAEPEYEEEEDCRTSCRGCGHTMDGDEGWGLTICSRSCYRTVIYGDEE